MINDTIIRFYERLIIDNIYQKIICTETFAVGNFSIVIRKKSRLLQNLSIVPTEYNLLFKQNLSKRIEVIKLKDLFEVMILVCISAFKMYFSRGDLFQLLRSFIFVRYTRKSIFCSVSFQRKLINIIFCKLFKPFNKNSFV